MRIAVCPGSFDPITYGHIDIIKRAARLFDRVIVVVLNNEAKKSLFSMEERFAFIEQVVNTLDNVTVDSADGLLVDYALKVGACAVVKGVRGGLDLEYEQRIITINRHLGSNIETILLPADVQYAHISSTLVREIATLGGNIEGLVPREMVAEIMSRCNG